VIVDLSVVAAIPQLFVDNGKVKQSSTAHEVLLAEGDQTVFLVTNGRLYACEACQPQAAPVGENSCRHIRALHDWSTRRDNALNPQPPGSWLSTLNGRCSLCGEIIRTGVDYVVRHRHPTGANRRSYAHTRCVPNAAHPTRRVTRAE
jgi:hypothetical protein